MARISGTIIPGARLMEMLRKQGHNWIQEQESEWSATSIAIGMLLLFAGGTLILIGVPIVAAVLGVE